MGLDSLSSETVHIDPYDVTDEELDALRKLIEHHAVDADALPDEFQIETLILDSTSDGMDSHANIFYITES